MNTPAYINKPLEDPACTTTGITIIYEDRAAGLRAKHFSDQLVTALGNPNQSTPACWRGELLDLPEIAEEIARDAAASEFVILSLRGDASLSVAAKLWIELWLAGAAGGSSSLVALFDPEHSTVAHAESVRFYLRSVAGHAGIAFFSHCRFVDRERLETAFPEDEKPVAKSQPRRRSQNFNGLFLPPCLAA